MFLVNPITKRAIKKGSKTYYKLVEAGHFKPEEADDKPVINNIICNTRGMNIEDLSKIRKDFNTYNPDYQAIVGRGELSEFLIRRKRGTTRQERIEELARKVKIAIQDSDRIDMYLDGQGDDSENGLSDFIESLILSEYKKMCSKKKFLLA